ncbi:uncharacterized protein [Branchiostoma lanceolatum]|uniref:Hypp1985 protein n=1 Tax=Branchiostoma lanceolatum TaxID=7740 RepID=A0A8J9ZP46_BRALA|nr:Hypp1985 [Branchiostoma lanceolatum]
MAQKLAVFLLFTFILSVSVGTGNAWKFLKRNKNTGSNIARKVKRSNMYDQNWVDDAINAGCVPHQEPCNVGTFCCPASHGRFGFCSTGVDGNNRCEYVIVEQGTNSQGPVGLN